jgi:hypothetical protein
MQIVHSVQFSDVEIEKLFEFARIVGEVEESTGYDSTEKPPLIAENTKNFKLLLAEYAREAFDYGYKVGANTANVKDTAMYS